MASCLSLGAISAGRCPELQQRPERAGTGRNGPVAPILEA